VTKPYTPKPPRTLAQATTKVQRIAQLDTELALIEATRSKQHADTDKVADDLALPLLEERRRLAADVEPWWVGSGAAELTQGKRRSVLLAGCTIGTKAARAKVEHDFTDDDAAVEAIMGKFWARKSLLKVTHRLDRTAIMAALDSRRAGELGELGFRRSAPADVFFVALAEQPGTVTSAAG